MWENMLPLCSPTPSCDYIRAKGTEMKQMPHFNVDTSIEIDTKHQCQFRNIYLIRF